MYAQTEYLLAYAMVFGFLILGMLIVCVPRPRKSGFVDPEQAAKDKRTKIRNKTQNKLKKKNEKAKQKKAKAFAQKVKQKK